VNLEPHSTLAFLGMLPAYLFLSFQVAGVRAGSQFALSQSSLVFAPGWISSTTAASESFLFTDKLGQALTVTLPKTTSSLNYVGLKRTGGSIYGVCVDCASGTTTNLQLFSGHDGTLLNNADAEPATIFSLAVDPAQEHVLQIMNIADNSFGGKSELTFISIVVDVQSSSTSTSTLSVTASKSSASSSTFTTSIAPTASSVSMSLSTSASASATAATASGLADNQTRNSLIIIIIVLALTAALSLAVGLVFYYRRERRRIPTLVDLDRIKDPPTMKEATVTPLSHIPSGFLAMAGRRKPPARLLESYNYQRNNVPQGGPILPASVQ
jgi:hypothetical protein